MWTPALFGTKNLGFFEIYGVSAQSRREGSNFRNFVPTSFMDSPLRLPWIGHVSLKFAINECYNTIQPRIILSNKKILLAIFKHHAFGNKFHCFKNFKAEFLSHTTTFVHILSKSAALPILFKPKNTKLSWHIMGKLSRSGTAPLVCYLNEHQGI